MYSVNLLLTQAKRRCLNKQTLHLSRSLRERLDMRKTLVLQHVCGPKWLPKENVFLLSRTLYEVLKLFSSLLGIQVMTCLVFSHSLTL